MRSKVLALVEKEIKDLLRDPRIYIGLVVPLLMFPLMGYLMEASLKGVTEASVRGLSAGVLNQDYGQWGASLVQFLASSGLNLTLKAGSIEGALESSRAEGLAVLIVIPRDLSANITSLTRASVHVYYLIERTSMAELAISGAVGSLLNAYSRSLSDMIISSGSQALNPEFARDPLSATSSSVLRGHELDLDPGDLLSRLSLQGLFVPLIIFVLSTVVAQTAASATAVENEEKTLETLLTFPVPRFYILLAKLAGSMVIAVIGAVLYFISFMFYMGPLSNTVAGQASGSSILGGFQPLIQPPAVAYLALAVSMLVAVVFTTALGVIVGALSNDVRIATSMIGIIVIPTMVPFFVISFAGDLSILPLPIMLLVYALPTTYPMIAGREILLGSIPSELALGTAYSLALTLAVTYLASRLLSPDKILALQHRLSGLARRRTEVER